MSAGRPSEEALAAFRTRVRDVIAAHAPETPAREGHRAPTSPEQERALRAWFRCLYDEGLVGADWPVELGGRADHHPLHDPIVTEEILRARAPRPVEQVQLATHVLLRFGTAAQQQHYLPRIRTAEDIWCQLFSEPGAGSDLAGVRTRGIQQPDGSFVLSGQKTWITDAHWADMGLAIVRTDPESTRHAGLTTVLVPMRAPGVEIRPLRTIAGSVDFNEVFLDDVRLPADHVVGGVGDGWKVVMAGLEVERFGIAGNVVLLELLFDDVLTVARHLDVDGTAAIDLDDVRDALAQLAVEAAAARAVAHDHVERTLAGRDEEGDAAIAKITYAECYHAIVAYAVHLRGQGRLAPDPVAEAAAERLQECWLWSRAYTISGGSSEIMRNILARRRLRLPSGSRGRDTRGGTP
jgi:alkylation response protein AidB-like acyl-CoA dehydrogenase